MLVELEKNDAFPLFVHNIDFSDPKKALMKIQLLREMGSLTFCQVFLRNLKIVEFVLDF
jgi:hypothetical protein